jgi:hypothetical protein
MGRFGGERNVCRVHFWLLGFYGGFAFVFASVMVCEAPGDSAVGLRGKYMKEAERMSLIGHGTPRLVRGI